MLAHVLLYSATNVILRKVTYKVEFSSLEQFLSLDGVLLDVDGDGEDGVGAGGLGVEEGCSRLSPGPTQLQDGVHLVFGVDLDLIKTMDHHRALHQHTQIYAIYGYFTPQN